MTVRIISSAKAELNEAVAYYNEQCPGLGFEFAAEVKAAVARITDFPDAWPRFSPRSRRCLLDRFPYGILYHQSEKELLVLAIMHLKRAPKCWQDRLHDAVGEQVAPRGRRKRRGNMS